MKAAIRHLLRSKGRSLLTLLAVLIPVYTLVFMFGFASANLRDMFETATNLESGHFQVREVQEHATGGTLPLIDDVAPVLDALDETNGVAWRTIRLDVPALASVGERSEAVFVQGVEPETVARITPIETLIVEGAYLTDGSNGAVIGVELAETLGLSIGGEIILLGAHPEAAMGVLKVPVVGIFDAPDASMGRGLIQVDLASARSLVRRPTTATAVVAMVEGVTGPWDVDKIDAVTADLSTKLPEGFEIVDWRELAPMVVSYMNIMRPALMIMAGTFFILGALVVVNTLYLSVMERTRELGLIRALGSSRLRVMGMIMTEAGILAVAGAFYGAIAGLAVIWIVEAFGGIPLPSSFAEVFRSIGLSGVIHLRAELGDVVLSAVAMAAVALFAALFPAWRAAQFEPVEAMRYVE
jgi:ABC-type lipoprotein release transport system permease subunit